MAHPVDVGQVSEAMVVAELVRGGHQVLLPYGVNHRYDVAVDAGRRGIVRIQVKTGVLRRGAVVFRPCSVRSTTRRTLVRGYAGDCELFAVHCPQNGGLYAVAVEDAGTRSCSLRIDPPANGMAQGIRWAADHLLADWRPPE